MSLRRGQQFRQAAVRLVVARPAARDPGCHSSQEVECSGSGSLSTRLLHTSSEVCDTKSSGSGAGKHRSGGLRLRGGEDGERDMPRGEVSERRDQSLLQLALGNLPDGFAERRSASTTAAQRLNSSGGGVT